MPSKLSSPELYLEPLRGGFNDVTEYLQNAVDKTEANQMGSHTEDTFCLGGDVVTNLKKITQIKIQFCLAYVMHNVRI